MRKIFAILLLITSFSSCNNAHVDTHNHEDINLKENISEIWTHQIIQEYIDNNSEKFAEVNNTNISYILDIQKRNNKTYFVANIGYNFDFRFQTTQMLYIDSLNKQVFEYDTFNDSLILWPKSTHIDPSGSYKLKTNSIFDKDMLISPTGEIFVKSFSQDKMIIFFEYIKGGPSNNTGSFLDTLNVTNNQAIYTTKTDSSCKIFFQIGSNYIEVIEETEDYNCGCGFGHGVVAIGKFTKYSDSPPNEMPY
ncbi:MAG: hypothetical protein ACWA41_06000 [Putridiphycobacter sp.]